VEENNQTWTRLFTCNVDGSDLFEFDFSGVVTHLAWQDEHHLLAYGLKKDVGDHYYLIKDQSNEYKIIGEKEFSSDGHPNFSPDKQTIITDTYPDRKRRQFLIMYNMENEQKHVLAIVRSPLKFMRDLRCDLHPRWNREGTSIAFDSAYTGIRSLCTLSLQEESQ
jgi:Tol biopolymer transport system component